MTSFPDIVSRLCHSFCRSSAAVLPLHPARLTCLPLVLPPFSRARPSTTNRASTPLYLLALRRPGYRFHSPLCPSSPPPPRGVAAMNLLNRSKNEVLFVNFNQDYRHAPLSLPSLPPSPLAPSTFATLSHDASD